MEEQRREASRAEKLKSIEELMARYCFAHDERRLDLLEGCLAVGIVRHGAEGRDAVMRQYAEVYEAQSDVRRRHVLTNFLFLEEGEREARVQAYETFYLIKGEEVTLHLTGIYRVHAVLEEGRWLVQGLESAFDVPYDPGDYPRVEASRFSD